MIPDVDILSPENTISVLEFILLLVALYGLKLHISSYQDAVLDLEAIKVAKIDPPDITDELIVGAQADIKEELVRVLGKLCWATLFFTMMFYARSMVQYLDFVGILAFCLQLTALLLLDYSAWLKRDVRKNLIRKALARQARSQTKIVAGG